MPTDISIRISAERHPELYKLFSVRGTGGPLEKLKEIVIELHYLRAQQLDRKILIDQIDEYFNDDFELFGETDKKISRILELMEKGAVQESQITWKD